MKRSFFLVFLVGIIFWGCDTRPYHFEIQDSGTDTDTHIDSGTDSDTEPDTYTDTDSDTDTDTDSDVDSDTDTDTYPDTEPDTDSDTDSDADAGGIDECEGILIQDVCWYATEKGVSCDEHCEQHGANYDEATCTIGGDIESPSNCESIITRFVSESSNVQVVVSPTHASIGCWAMSLNDWEIYGGVDELGCESGTKKEGRHRFCACTF